MIGWLVSDSSIYLPILYDNGGPDRGIHAPPVIRICIMEINNPINF